MKLNLLTLLFLFQGLSLFSMNTTIYSKGLSTYEDMFNLISRENPKLDEEYVSVLVSTYMEEARAEGINWDVAFVQMCLETGFLNYGGLVTPDQNNFCGLGSFNGKSGAKFDTVRLGVRAHIQHLKAYGTDKELNYKLIDPRFHFVKRGSATDVTELTGKWATDPNYGRKLVGLLERLHYPKENLLIADSSADEVMEDPTVFENNPENDEKDLVETENKDEIKEDPTLKKGWDW